MSNLTITNNNLSNSILLNGRYRDGVLAVFGAGTIKAGTILARKVVNDAVTVTPDVGNTGDGTVSNAEVVAGDTVPKVGDYVFECIESVANGGIFKLEDPDGQIVNSYLLMTAGAGASTVFVTNGLTFEITDGATDFIVGDKFTLTLTGNSKLEVFSKTGKGGTQIPISILTYEIVATGASDIPIRYPLSGEFRKEQLVIDADGDDSNIDESVIDKLRDYALIPVNVTERNIYDNQ